MENKARGCEVNLFTYLFFCFLFQSLHEISLLGNMRLKCIRLFSCKNKHIDRHHTYLINVFVCTNLQTQLPLALQVRPRLAARIRNRIVLIIQIQLFDA